LGPGPTRSSVKRFWRTFHKTLHQIAIRLPPAKRFRTILESHLVDPFCGGDIDQPGEHALQGFGSRRQEPTQPILRGVKLHAG
jgi:hypothetical protein